MARVKKALSGLPWVDQKSVQANVATKEVRFQLSDPAQLDEDRLQQAFAGVGFDTMKVLSKPAAGLGEQNKRAGAFHSSRNWR